MDSTPPGNPHPASTHDELDPAAIVQALKTKRKPRTTKSCFPCRHRKVRCGGSVPCSNCVRRNHAELCGTGGASGVRKPSPQHGVRGASERWESPAESVDDSVAHGYPVHENPNVNANHVLAQLEKIEERISSLKSDLLHSSPPSGNHYGPTTLPGQQSSYDPVKAAGEWAVRMQHTIPAVLSGTHVVELATGAPIFLGKRSDPPAVLGCRSTPASGVREGDDSGLDQLAPKTYSFASPWAAQTSVADAAKVLPDDSDVIRYWSVYQACVHPFYPALVSYDEFGARLFSFLNCRQTEHGEDRMLDVDPSWLALLFSVLACGVQFSADPIKERDLRSKVFVCSSFECLRMSNLFTTTDMNQIQTMALLCHCLRNNLDMNTAWIVMGSTIRLAQSIGLHIEPTPATSSSSSPAWSTPETSRRHRLWWMLLWQDSFLSFTYDRPPASLYTPGTVPAENAPGIGSSFATSMFRICQIILARERDETTGAVNTVESLLGYRHQLRAVLEEAQPFLQDKARCTTLQENLERAALHVHIGYLVCRVYRISLECDDKAADQALRDSLATEYLSSAAHVVQSFLDMHRLLPAVCRTWAFVHNVASSAIPLKGLASVSPALLENLVEQFMPSVQRLIGVLESEAKECEWYDADTNAVLASLTPTHRLRKLASAGPLSWAWSKFDAQGEFMSHAPRRAVCRGMVMALPKEKASSGATQYSRTYSKHIGMVAGGTGITPMYQLIRAICADQADDTKTPLLYANNIEEDILLRDEPEAFALQCPEKFQVRYVVTKPPPRWTGGSGFVTGDFIKKHLSAAPEDSRVLLCGPPPRINAMKKNLSALWSKEPRAIAKATD